MLSRTSVRTTTSTHLYNMDKSQYPCYNPRGVQTDYVCSECPQWNGEMCSETARIKALEKEAKIRDLPICGCDDLACSCKKPKTP